MLAKEIQQQQDRLKQIESQLVECNEKSSE